MSISSVTSEALQLKLRQLLPSQAGFGTDLSASDTIIPIIDLTRAAEGSDVPQMLQTALSYDSQTAFDVSNTTTTIINTTGFYRIFGVHAINANGAVSINLNDGAADKLIQRFAASANTLLQNFEFDLVVFFNASESYKITANAFARSVGSVRQIADKNGNLVNPAGFLPQ